jgi:DNA-binding XRE family transcriptional regulator
MGFDESRRVAMKRRLREVREAHFLSQEELANRAGLARFSVSRIENGRVRPRLWTIRRLAETLGVPPETLLAGPGA